MAPEHLGSSGELTEWLHALFESMMDSVISFDHERKVLLFNKAAEAMFKLPAEEAIGGSIDRFIPERHRTAADIDVSHVLGAFIGLRSNGEEFPFESSTSCAKINQCDVYTVVLRDVSERKYIERQISHLLKMEALGRLAGGIAHDFNNLLMIVRANVEMTLSGGLGPQRVASNLQAVLDAAKRGASLVAQLMVFSRQRQSKEFEPVNVAGVLNDVQTMIPRLIGEDIEFVIKNGNIEWAVGDANQLFQVLVNMLLNSKDAMPSGGKITISTEMVVLDEHYAQLHLNVKPGQYVLIAVEDNGTGMSPEVKERMFDPFYTTKAEGKGTGLGLAFVAGALDACGGHVSVYSELGKGTCIKLFLPTMKERFKIPASAKLEPISNERSYAVLLVEDERALRSIICEVLVSKGYSVLEANNGTEAIEVAKRHHDRIAVVISDMVMPTMGGIEMAKRLKKIIPDFALILMSGYNEISDKLPEVGGKIKMLSKPFAMQELLAVIVELTSKENE